MKTNWLLSLHWLQQLSVEKVGHMTSCMTLQEDQTGSGGLVSQENTAVQWKRKPCVAQEETIRAACTSNCGSLFSSSKDSCYVMPRRLCYIIQKLYHLLKLLGQRKRLQTRVWLALLNWNDYCPQVNTSPFCHSGYLKRPQMHPAAIPNMYLTNTILWSISHGSQQMQLKSHFLFSYW